MRTSSPRPRCSGGLGDGEVDCDAEVTAELTEIEAGGFGRGDDQVGAGRQVEITGDGPQPTTNPVAHHCGTDPAADSEGHPRPGGRVAGHRASGHGVDERDHRDRTGPPTAARLP